MTDSGLVFENLARLRKARNLSQEELAEAAGVGVDTVGRIERRERATVRPTTVAKLARALAVQPAALLLSAAQSRAARTVDADALRRAVCATGEVPGLLDPAEGDDVIPVAELVAAGRRAWSWYVAGRTAELLTELPALLADARRVVHASDGDADAEAHRVLALGYRLGAGVAGRLGLDDLAWSSAERALTAVRRSTAAELETAVSLRYLAWVLVRQGRAKEAEQVALRAAEAIQPRMLDKDRTRAAVFGNLLFNAASAAVAAGRYEQSRDYLTHARSAATPFDADHVSEAAIFGRRVVGLHAVELAVRTGEPATALRLAERLPLTDGAVPSFWEAGHRLHLARAAVELKRTRDALVQLHQAREIAPVWSSHQPLGRSTMWALVQRSARRRDARFASLAVHYGAAT